MMTALVMMPSSDLELPYVYFQLYLSIMVRACICVCHAVSTKVTTVKIAKDTSDGQYSAGCIYCIRTNTAQ